MKLILDLCGGTGAWSRPYQEAGYAVINATFPDYDITKWRDDFRLHTAINAGVYGILAAPPCDQFSRAKGGQTRDFARAMTVVSACMEIIWECRIQHRVTFWALENPMGLLRQFLGKPAMSVQPWWFGDFHTKHTDLWGYFNEPKRIVWDRPLLVPRIGSTGHGKEFSNPKKPKRYAHMKLSRADIRAITPPMFAKAFYEANK